MTDNFRFLQKNFANLSQACKKKERKKQPNEKKHKEKTRCGEVQSVAQWGLTIEITTQTNMLC